jgi:hypothetical protein
MARLGRIVASLPMSLVTLNQAPLLVRDALAIAISQSGQSPDVVEPIRYFRAGGEHGGAGQPCRFATGQRGAVEPAAACGRGSQRGSHQELHRQPGGRGLADGTLAG